ncbi:MAG: hypothetical protein WB762_21250 [Candidatus Sulfotelmatobacter sp.]
MNRRVFLGLSAEGSKGRIKLKIRRPSYYQYASHSGAVSGVRGENGAAQTDAPVNQSTKSSSTRAIGRKLEEKGVPNFGEVTPTLYRGELLSSGLKALARMGVRIVVDTR